MFKFTVFAAVACCSHVFGNVEMGDDSYGTPQIYSWGDNTKLKVGKYCSIGEEVKVMLGGEHYTDWVSTYPFSSRWPEVAGNLPKCNKSKGDVTIGNDVWIGNFACILSGVSIGNGAVVGAHAVVAKDVPPYAIVAGNPAKIIRYRFDENTIKRLEKFAWWDWPKGEIEKALPLILNKDIEAFLRFCEMRKISDF